MAFADLKNDFVFRRIFATHPDLLRGLLNDLLERTGDQAIVSIEYLPSEQLPLVAGAKLSILDVRCKDQSGAIFVVEMQLVHMPGFLNRVVYNGCKAYANQLKAGEPYTNLVDVVAISICDFELWPDEEQKAKGEPPMPMLSRFAMTEQSTGNRALLQVQYAFLELPKVPPQKPAGGAALWAWLFVHAKELREIPADLPPGPFREAMELANEAGFSALELEAYRKVMDEIQQARDYGNAKWEAGHKSGLAEGLAEGHKSGLAEGLAEGLVAGKRDSLVRIVELRGFSLTGAEREKIAHCKDPSTLDAWLKKALSASLTSEVFA